MATNLKEHSFSKKYFWEQQKIYTILFYPDIFKPPVWGLKYIVTLQIL